MADVLYNENYDGWNPNRSIRRFDPSVQYGTEDYAIDVPAQADTLPPKLNPVRTNASWVADDSCFPAPPPTTVTSTAGPGDGVTLEGITTSVLGPGGPPNIATIKCGQDQFVCPSDASKCIQADKMCDGFQDCPQGEDEICTEECGNAGAANKKGKLSGKIVGGAEYLPKVNYVRKNTSKNLPAVLSSRLLA
ncbi:hypothetical protein RvY_01908 [Ramazzottius varieornatus]|uniref:Uncharacterized protein n=1 Tax=Ramazzottius varieornatus TaxID=947166 RepID=A0A1D1UIS9_RAMVA|nr:hypothetical protein RvY_01908 [Ramazzottius varieornatus]